MNFLSISCLILVKMREFLQRISKAKFDKFSKIS